MTQSVDSLKNKHSGKSGVLFCPGPTLADLNPESIPSDCIVIAANIGIMQGVVPDYWVLTNWEARSKGVSFLFPDKTKLIVPEGQFPSDDPRHDDPLESAYGMEVNKEPRSPIMGIVAANIMGLTHLDIFGLDCFRTEDYYYFQKGIRHRNLTENRLIGYERIYGPVAYKAYQTKRLKELVCRFRDINRLSMSISIVNSPWSMIDNPTITRKTVKQFERDAWQIASHSGEKKELVEDEERDEERDS